MPVPPPKFNPKDFFTFPFPSSHFLAKPSPAMRKFTFEPMFAFKLHCLRSILKLEISGVSNPNHSGLKLAREMGIPCETRDDALSRLEAIMRKGEILT